MKQTLRYFDLVMIVVSLVIGMGIFKTPAQVAGASFSPTVFFLAWILGGLFASCGALTFAEIGSRLPVSGGYYRIFSYSYHPALAFMLNGTILISNAASVAGVAMIGAEYIASVVLPEKMEGRAMVQQLIAIGEILIFFGVNLLGLRTSARTQNLLTIFKLLVVVILCCSVFVPVTESHAAVSNTVAPEHNLGSWVLSLGLALIPVSFTYGGYQQTINFGGEVENAPRTTPRAILTGIAIVLLLYLAINFAYFKVIGFDTLQRMGQMSDEQLKSVKPIAKILAERLFSSRGGDILSLLLFFSVLAYVNVGLLSNPRVIVAMSEEKTLPEFFSRHSKKLNVPVVALTVFTIITLAVLVYAQTFEQLVKYVIFLDAMGFIGAASTIFILRMRKTGEEQNIYKMKLFPWITILFLLAYGFVAGSIAVDDWKKAAYGLVVFVAFFPIYMISRVFSK